MPPVYRLADLRTQVGRGAIRRAVDDGRLRHLRVDVYATSDIDELQARALAAGVSISCATALRVHGIWALDHGHHLRMRQHGGRVALSDAHIHVTGPHNRTGLDDVGTALRVAARCVPFDELIAATDSALHQGRVSVAEVTAAVGTGARGRRVRAAIDPLAESGLESLARVRLRARGVRCRSQVVIVGVGRVDLLVGDRLVIELDGEQWHSSVTQREVDRRRDAELVTQGYLVLRAGYRRVVDDWDGFEEQVITIIRRRGHRWPEHRG